MTDTNQYTTRQTEGLSPRIDLFVQTLMGGKYCVVDSRDVHLGMEVIGEKLGGKIEVIDRTNLMLAVGGRNNTPSFVKGYILVAPTGNELRGNSTSYMWFYDRSMLDDSDFDMAASVGQIFGENNGVEAYQILAPRGEA